MEGFQLSKILTGCRKNNRAAQEKLYKHFFGLMYHVCRDFAADRDEARSLINEGFLKIFTAISSYDESKGSFETWAKRIMTNTCIDHSRRQKAMQSLSPISDADELSAGQVIYSRIAEKEIMQSLKHLPDATQTVFSLYVFRGYSHREISESMKIAESTSRWHVMEARKTLKRLSDKIL